jgi:hypothetical protein
MANIDSSGMYIESERYSNFRLILCRKTTIYNRAFITQKMKRVSGIGLSSSWMKMEEENKAGLKRREERGLA